jgi:hypothetical protein
MEMQRECIKIKVSGKMYLSINNPVMIPLHLIIKEGKRGKTIIKNQHFQTQSIYRVNWQRHKITDSRYFRLPLCFKYCFLYIGSESNMIKIAAALQAYNL